MTSNEEMREFMIRCCKLEIRRLYLQLSLTYSPEEKSKIELQIKQEKTNLDNTKWSKISNELQRTTNNLG